MSLTNTDRQARRAKRPVGLRDLRFAGTVAAGLVAGVLGVGALSAPLLDWNDDWPDASDRGGQDDPLTLRAGEDARDKRERSGRSNGGGAGDSVVTIPGPRGS